MKIIAIGDIHGRTMWRTILGRHEDADKIVFIGDYVDTHEDITGVEQANNLEAIIKLKQDNPSKVVLLVGNHDYQYWPGVLDERYSGYQHRMAPTFQFMFNEAKDLFQMCYVDENEIVYSHAGFTETFVEQRIGSFSEKNVNDVFKYKPQSFKFYYGDYSGCGDDIHQSCIWVRPQSLYRDKIDNLMVVGHTSVNKISHPPKSERRGFYMIDALGSTKEYLVIKDGEVSIDRL